MSSSSYLDSDHRSLRQVELCDTIDSFHAWKPFIRAYLSGKNLLDTINPDVLNEDEVKESESKLTGKEVRKQKNEAHAILFKSMNPSLFQLFEDESVYPLGDPLTLWKGILTHFQMDTLTNKNYLRTQLYQSKMKPHETVDVYVSRIQQLSRSLKSIDTKWQPDDAELNYFILNGLPDSYKPIKLIIENEKNLSKSELIKKLRQYQESELLSSNKPSSVNKNMKRSSFDEDGVSYYHQQSNRTPYMNKSYSSSNQSRNNRPPSQGNRTNGLRQCYTCNETSHMAFECPRNANIVKCSNCRYIGGHRTEECRKPTRQRNSNPSMNSTSQSSMMKNPSSSSIKNNYSMKNQVNHVQFNASESHLSKNMKRAYESDSDEDSTIAENYYHATVDDSSHSESIPSPSKPQVLVPYQFIFKHDRPLPQSSKLNQVSVSPSSSINTSNVHTEPQVVLSTLIDDESMKTQSSASTVDDDGDTEVTLVADSGTSVHTCNDSTLLSHMHEASTPLLIKDANGNVAQYTHKGTLQVKSVVNGEVKRIDINDVYYAPNCPVNLLSVACLARRGKRVVFYADDARIIRKKDSNVTMEFQRVNNIYVAKVKLAPRTNQHTNQSTQHALFNSDDHSNASVLVSLTQPTTHVKSTSESKSLSTFLQWHRRLGHASTSGMSKMLQSPYIVDMQLQGDTSVRSELPSCLTLCEACVLAKSHRKEFHSRNSHQQAMSILDRAHSDIFGPVEVASVHGHRYMLTITDERSRKSFVWPLQHKSEAPSLIIQWCDRVHTETTKKLVEFHSDNGTEFVNSTLKEYFTQHGILFTTTTVATPQHNGIAERLNRTLWESCKAMLSYGKLPRVLWKEAMLTANYIRNYRPTAVLKAIPPNSVWKKEVYLLRNVDTSVCLDKKHFECSLKHLRTFGCNVYVHVPEAQRKKLDNVSERGIFIGYSNDRVGYYHILVLRTRKLVRSRDVTFHEDSVTFAQEYANLINNGGVPVRNQVVSHVHVSHDDEADSQSDSDSDSESADHESDSDEPHSQLNDVNRRTIRVKMRLQNQVVHEDDVPLDAINQESNQVEQHDEAMPQVGGPHQGNMFGIINSTDPAIGVARFDKINTSNIISEGRALRSRHVNMINVTQPNQSNTIPLLSSVSPIDEAVPQTYNQAMKSHNHSYWKSAMDKEMQSLIIKQVFEMVDRPAGAHIMQARWVYALKPNPEAKSQADKNIYKGRIVVKGFTQKAGVDYFETFAPVARYKSFRLLFSLATSLDYELKHLDVPTAFLNADLEEDAYMEQPPGYSNGDSSKVWKLKKSLYGTKQAPHNWNKELDQTLVSAGLTRCKADTCIYVKRSKNGKMMLLGVFVDDLIPLYDKCDEDEWKMIQQILFNKYKIKEVSQDGFILGMRITRDRSNHLLKIDQEAYIDKMLQQFGMVDCKPNQLPTLTYKLSMKDSCQSAIASNNIELDHSALHDAIEEGKSSLNINQPYDANRTALYQQIVGSLNYASISTRPDITYAVHILSCHLKNPGPNHLTAAKVVLRYLKGTKDVGLIFNGEHSMMNPSNLFSLHIDAYSDSDWAGDVDDRHSTNGYVIQLNQSTISWRSKKQNRVALSSCEAEYYALCATMQEVMWFSQFLHELLSFDLRYQPHLHSPIRTILHVDNQAAIQLSKYDVHHDRTKHIPLRYHFVREEIKNNQVQVQYIPTQHQLADMFTKGLNKILFNNLRQKIMSGNSQLDLGISTSGCFNISF